MKKIHNDLLQKEKEGKILSATDPRRLAYHLMPPTGWLNDPNGLCRFNGTTHIFYQYSPDNCFGGNKAWGHYTTKDYIHYKELPIALYPDSWMDQNGAYSGSCYEKDGLLHFFYTGNIKFEGNHDYIHSGRGHYVNHFTSPDGYEFSDKECLLKNEDYPSDMTCHVRDPKVFSYKGHDYMVLGARTNKDEGCVLIFKALDKDLKKWEYQTRIETEKPFGYMWECPDLFQLEGKDVLITCPQGLEQDGYKYQPLYQNGYFILKGNPEEGYTPNEFTEMDYGFDFYAPQTYLDDQNRRILIGWMGLPDVEYKNPETDYKWQHALTLPRVLRFKEDKLYGYPIEEITALRKEEIQVQLKKDETYDLKTQIGEIQLSDLPDEFTIHFRKDIVLKYQNKVFTLKMKDSGMGRNSRNIPVGSLKEISIFSDSSSLEIFLNHGEYSLTTRVYDESDKTSIQASENMDMTFYPYNSFEVETDLKPNAYVGCSK